jgi:hypothetical protein
MLSTQTTGKRKKIKYVYFVEEKTQPKSAKKKVPKKKITGTISQKAIKNAI